MSSQFRRSTTCRATYPDLPGLTEQPRTVTIHQEMGSHDVAVLQYRTISAAYFARLKTGVPIRISWATPKSKGEFVGYVSHTSGRYAPALQEPMYVTCVGASYPLKERANNTWHGKTATAVARDIAKKHKLKIVTVDHKTKFPQLSQAGHSYWEFLNELASRIGYALRVEGVTLYFLPIDKMIDQHMTSIPVLTFFADQLPTFAHLEDRTLDTFEPLVGDYVEQGPSRTAKVVSGVDPFTAKSFSSTAKPSAKKNLRSQASDTLFSEFRNDQVAGSRAMAADLAKAKAEHARMAIPARAFGQGDARISPFHTVEIEGTSEATDGYWIVKSAVHTILYDGRYQVEMELGTDGTRGNKGGANRPKTASGKSGVVNTKAIAGRPASPALKRSVPIVNERKTGFKTTPSRWKA